jgi:hypothetical protein
MYPVDYGLWHSTELSNGSHKQTHTDVHMSLFVLESLQIPVCTYWEPRIGKQCKLEITAAVTQALRVKHTAMSNMLVACEGSHMLSSPEVSEFI